jgi:hypothetical protein
MRQELVNGQRLPMHWQRRQILPNRVPNPELPAFLENQYGGCRELLGHRTDSEFCRRKVWDGLLDIRHAVPMSMQDLLASCDEHYPTEPYVLGLPDHVGL